MPPVSILEQMVRDMVLIDDINTLTRTTQNISHRQVIDITNLCLPEHQIRCIIAHLMKHSTSIANKGGSINFALGFSGFSVISKVIWHDDMGIAGGQEAAFRDTFEKFIHESSFDELDHARRFTKPLLDAGRSSRVRESLMLLKLNAM